MPLGNPRELPKLPGPEKMSKKKGGPRGKMPIKHEAQKKKIVASHSYGPSLRLTMPVQSGTQIYE